MPVESSDARVSWRELGPTVLYPNLLYGIGQGAIIPAVPIVATAMGGNLAVAALAAAMMSLGQLVGSPPGAWLIAKLGENATMVLGAVLAAVGGLVGGSHPT